MLSRLALRNAQALPLALRQSHVAVASANVPRPVRPEYPDPVRFGVIPDNWFTFFYPKTGVTGPYMFGISVGTYLLSKEIYVLEHEFINGVAFLITWIILVKKVGPIFSDFIGKEQDKWLNEMNDQKQENIDELEGTIKSAEMEKRRTEAQLMLYDIRKQGVQMLLEAVYRERLMHVYKEVKKRLDYQVQIQQVERRIAQKHMVQWIINSVMKAITPEQEKATLQQCIKDLETLAAKA